MTVTKSKKRSGRGGARFGAGRPRNTPKPPDFQHQLTVATVERRLRHKREVSEAARVQRLTEDISKLAMKLKFGGSHRYPVADNRIALCVVLGLVKGNRHVPAMLPTPAIALAADLLQRSKTNLYKLYEQYRQFGVSAILSVPQSTRGFAHPNYKHTVLAFKQYGASVRKFVECRRRSGRSVTAESVQRYLLKQHAMDANINTLRVWMWKDLGLRYGRCQRVHANWGADELRVLERQYIVDYAEELKRQSDGDTVLVYSDESFLHQGHASLFSWFDPDSDLGKMIKKVHEHMNTLITQHAPLSGTIDNLIVDDNRIKSDNQSRVRSIILSSVNAPPPTAPLPPLALSNVPVIGTRSVSSDISFTGGPASAAPLPVPAPPTGDEKRAVDPRKLRNP